ncbi:TetR/AcrR family transcriptional regulator [Actinomadura sp. 3N407]|uniref:TetR/AcrR family transcriptional regulator n=1 Tax=Actinomadura sp. 3N407 TaxID=3457423 RepID=UPI003FCC642E
MRTKGAPNWLDTGLELLGAQGVQAVTLDRLCERMGVSKGAFYHHFGSMPRFRTALLAHFEAKHTASVIDAVEAVEHRPARERLQRLMDRAVAGDPRLEVGIRAWAKQDSTAAATLARVDARRIGYLRDLCEQIGHTEPELIAELLYVVTIGGTYLVPPLSPVRKRAVFEVLRPLVERPDPPTSHSESSDLPAEKRDHG